MSDRSTPNSRPDSPSGSLAGSDDSGNSALVASCGRLVASAKSREQRMLQPTGEEGERSALQTLEELFREGKLSGRRAAQLRDSYVRLADAYSKAQQSEGHLMNEAKALTQELAKTEARLSAVDEAPCGNNTETAQQRNLLLKHRNSLAMIEERMEKLNYDIKLRTEERDELREEIERRPKKEEVEARINLLQGQIENLKTDLSQRTADAAAVKSDLERTNQSVALTKEDSEKALFMQVEVKDELVKARNELSNLQRQIVGLQKEKQEVESEEGKLCSKHGAKLIEQKDQSTHLQTVTRQHEQQRLALKQQEQHHEECEKELARIVNVYDNVKEEVTTLTGDKLQHEMQMQQLEQTKQLHSEDIARMSKEKEMQVKMLKVKQLQSKTVKDTLRQLAGKKKKLEIELAGVIAQGESIEESLVHMRNERKKAVADNEQQGVLSTAEKDKVKGYEEKEQEYLFRIGQMRRVTRLGNNKLMQAMKERDDRVRESERLRNEISAKQNRMHLLDNEAHDWKKHVAHAEQSLRTLVHLHDLLKAERAKLAKLTALCERKKVEVRDKARLHGGIKDVLEVDIENKSRMLQKASVQYKNEVSTRERMKQEEVEALHDLRDCHIKVDHQSNAINGMNALAKRTEASMVEDKERYKRVLEEVGKLGIAVVNADEDLCVLYHNSTLLDTVRRDAEVEMHSLEEGIRFAKVELANEERALAAIHARVPSKRLLDDELVVSQIQLSQSRDEIAKLEKEIQDPDCQRVRFLGGEDPSMAELLQRQAELDTQISEKEKQRQEKILMLTEVTRMVEATQKDADMSKDETVSDARKMNQLKAKLEKVTNKLKAAIAEVACVQNELIREQRTVAAMAAALVEGNKRLEQGLAPNAEAAEEWRRSCRYQEQHEEVKNRVEELEEGFRVTANGVLTTAEERGNAYMAVVDPAKDDSNPLRPYVPKRFKAQAPSTALRHYRKPANPPIDV